MGIICQPYQRVFGADAGGDFAESALVGGAADVVFAAASRAGGAGVVGRAAVSATSLTSASGDASACRATVTIDSAETDAKRRAVFERVKARVLVDALGHEAATASDATHRGGGVKAESRPEGRHQAPARKNSAPPLRRIVGAFFGFLPSASTAVTSR